MIESALTASTSSWSFTDYNTYLLVHEYLSTPQTYVADNNTINPRVNRILNETGVTADELQSIHYNNYSVLDSGRTWTGIPDNEFRLIFAKKLSNTVLSQQPRNRVTFTLGHTFHVLENLDIISDTPLTNVTLSSNNAQMVQYTPRPNEQNDLLWKPFKNGIPNYLAPFCTFNLDCYTANGTAPNIKVVAYFHSLPPAVETELRNNTDPIRLQNSTFIFVDGVCATRVL